GIPDLIKINSREAKIILFDGCAILKSNKFCIQTRKENLKSVISGVSFDDIDSIDMFYDLLENKSEQLLRKIKIEIESDGISKVNMIPYEGNIISQDNSFNDFLLDNAINLIEDYDASVFENYYSYAVWTGIPVISLVIIQIIFNFSSGFYFYKNKEIALSQAKSRYQRIFNSDDVMDIKNEWNNRLKSSISYGEYKSFSFIFSSVLVEIINEIKDKNKFKLNDFRFDSGDGSFRINMEVDDISFLDALKTKLKNKNIG